MGIALERRLAPYSVTHVSHESLGERCPECQEEYEKAQQMAKTRPTAKVSR